MRGSLYTSKPCMAYSQSYYAPNPSTNPLEQITLLQPGNTNSWTNKEHLSTNTQQLLSNNTTRDKEHEGGIGNRNFAVECLTPSALPEICNRNGLWPARWVTCMWTIKQQKIHNKSLKITINVTHHIHNFVMPVHCDHAHVNVYHQAVYSYDWF